MMGPKRYLDAKIDMIVAYIHAGIRTGELPFIVRDVQDSHDAARAEPIEDFQAYRVRCSKLLTCARWLLRTATGRDLEYLEALEGVLLEVLRKSAS